MDEKPKLKKSEGGVSDPREIPTKLNLVKNEFRAMGLKMSYEPEGESIDESGRRERDQETYGLGGRPGDDRPSRPLNAPTGPKKKPKVKDVNKTAIAMVMAKHGGKKNFL